MCVDALSLFWHVGWRLARSLNNRFSSLAVRRMSKWFRPLCSPRRSTTGRSGGVHSLRSALQAKFFALPFGNSTRFQDGGENTIYVARRAYGREQRKLNNYPHRVYCIFGLSRLHDCQFGNNCNRNSVVPQFEFLSFSSCASAMASSSLSARRRSELGETFSVIAMLCLRPAILPLSMLSLNSIREYSHASNPQWKFFSCKGRARRVLACSCRPSSRFPQAMKFQTEARSEIRDLCRITCGSIPESDTLRLQTQNGNQTLMHGCK